MIEWLTLQDPKGLPTSIKDVVYLLGDHYFKNSDFEKTLSYFHLDLCFNPNRVDTWFPLGLALINGLEPKVISTEQISMLHHFLIHPSPLHKHTAQRNKQAARIKPD